MFFLFFFYFFFKAEDGIRDDLVTGVQTCGLPILVDLDSRSDTQPAYEAIQNIVSEDPSAVDSIAEHWLYVALCRRDVVEMGRALASLPPEGIVRRDLLMPRPFCEGLVARARGDVTRAEKAFNAAHLEMEKILREQPDYAQAFCVLGLSDA